MRTLLLTLLLLSGFASQAQYSRKSGHNAIPEGRNVVSFMPFGFSVAHDEFNPSVGIDYEYIVSPEAGIGLHIPFVFGYEGPEQTGNTYRHTAIYTAPGIRFHAPFGGRKNGEFVTGLSAMLGNMHFRVYNDGYNTTTGLRPYDYSLSGIATDNSLNFYNRHFQFGLDFRIGTLFNNYEDSRFFFQFGLHFGGKF